MRRLALLVVLGALSCQQPAPVPPPWPDASDAAPAPPPTPPPPPPAPVGDASDPAARACAILAARGCSLGRSPNCVGVMRLPAKFGVSADCVVLAGQTGSLAACNVACTP
jgi:hypothetical protein